MNEDFFAKALLISCVLLIPMLNFDHLTVSMAPGGRTIVGRTPEEKERVSAYIKSPEHTKLNRLCNLLFFSASLSNIFICFVLRAFLQWSDYEVCATSVLITCVILIWPLCLLGSIVEEVEKKYGLDSLNS